MNAIALRAKRKAAAEKPFPPPSAQWVSLARDRWVRYPIGDAGVRRLQELLATPPRVRMPCMLIYGVSGAGKSMLLEKFQRDHAQTAERRSGRRAIIAAELPPVPLLSSLYAQNHPLHERRRLTDHAVARIGMHRREHARARVAQNAADRRNSQSALLTALEISELR